MWKRVRRKEISRLTYEQKTLSKHCNHYIYQKLSIIHLNKMFLLLIYRSFKLLNNFCLSDSQSFEELNRFTNGRLQKEEIRDKQYSQ